MSILNNGRIGLGTGSVGAAKNLIDLAIGHANERHQFGQPIADFELVEEKIGWMVSYLFGLESMAYLTCGLVDQGVEDYSLESAICKVAGTEFLWYAANRAMQLRGGEGYMKTDPYEKIMRDIRIFPIFEGANDVMRCFIALSAMKPVGEKLSGLGNIGLNDPIGSIGVLADYVGGRVKREVRPDRITMAHPELEKHADAVSEQVKELTSRHRGPDPRAQEGRHASSSCTRSGCRAIADVYAQVAVLSRVTAIFEEQGVEPSGQERFIADSFCTRAAGRVRWPLRQIEIERRRADDRDRQARLQARRVRLRAVRRLTPSAVRPRRLSACSGVAPSCWPPRRWRCRRPRPPRTPTGPRCGR